MADTMLGFPIHVEPVQVPEAPAPQEPPVTFGPPTYRVSIPFAKFLAGLLSEGTPAECRASWEANKELSLLRDRDGFCWRPSTEPGEPNRFYGIPIVTDRSLEPGAFEFRDGEGRVLAIGTVRDTSERA